MGWELYAGGNGTSDINGNISIASWQSGGGSDIAVDYNNNIIYFSYSNGIKKIENETVSTVISGSQYMAPAYGGGIALCHRLNNKTLINLEDLSVISYSLDDNDPTFPGFWTASLSSYPIAIDHGGYIYAIDSNAGTRIYRSIDGGLTFHVFAGYGSGNSSGTQIDGDQGTARIGYTEGIADIPDGDWIYFNDNFSSIRKFHRNTAEIVTIATTEDVPEGFGGIGWHHGLGKIASFCYDLTTRVFDDNGNTVIDDPGSVSFFEPGYPKLGGEGYNLYGDVNSSGSMFSGTGGKISILSISPPIFGGEIIYPIYDSTPLDQAPRKTTLNSDDNFFGRNP